jgi:DNA-directed RNA polymerase subunit H (RpoH/RPB5)
VCVYVCVCIRCFNWKASRTMLAGKERQKNKRKASVKRTARTPSLIKHVSRGLKRGPSVAGIFDRDHELQDKDALSDNEEIVTFEDNREEQENGDEEDGEGNLGSGSSGDDDDERIQKVLQDLGKSLHEIRDEDDDYEDGDYDERGDASEEDEEDEDDEDDDEDDEEGDEDDDEEHLKTKKKKDGLTKQEKDKLVKKKKKKQKKEQKNMIKNGGGTDDGKNMDSISSIGASVMQAAADAAGSTMLTSLSVPKSPTVILKKAKGRVGKKCGGNAMDFTRYYKNYMLLGVKYNYVPPNSIDVSWTLEEKKAPFMETLRRMVTDRGFEVPPEPFLDEKNTLSAVFPRLSGGSTETTSLALYLCFSDNFGIAKARLIRKDLQEKGWVQAVVVFTHCPTSSANKLLKLQGLTTHLTLFHIDELLHPIVDHELVPKHTKVVAREAFLKNWYCNTKQLPILMKNDPVCKYYDFRVGDVIATRRHYGGYTPPTDYYRIVERGTLPAFLSN